MPNQEIIDYVEKAKKAGYPEQKIKEILEKAGWDDKDIDEAMLGQPEAPPVKPTAPPQKDPSVKSQPKAAKKDASQSQPATEKTDDIPGPVSDNTETQSAQADPGKPAAEPVSNTTAPESTQPVSEKTNVLAILSLIFAFLFPVIGLIFGIIAKSQIKKTGEHGKGTALAGIIISSIFIVIGILGFVFMVLIQGIAIDKLNKYNDDAINSAITNSQLIKCSSDVSLRIFQVGGNDRICLDRNGETGSLAIILENKGSIDISDWRFTAVGDSVSDTNGGYGGLEKSQIGNFRFNFDVAGPISSIRLSPKISGEASNPSVTCDVDLVWDAEQLNGMPDCNSVAWDDNI